MTALVVQKDRILSNLDTMRKETGVQVIPVLKGNAYGLGDVETAGILAGAGVKLFAVSRIEEAQRLAASLPEVEILLLTPYSTEADAKKIIERNITATVGSYDSAVLLNGLAEKSGVKARVHIKFDTGMGRFGFLPEEAEKAAQAAKYLKNLEIAGCFTHLSNSFSKHRKDVLKQAELFNGCISVLRNEGINPGITHIANSVAAIDYPELRMDAVRIGSALLGRVPAHKKLGLKQVGNLQCAICDIRWLPAGHNIGYANTYRTKNPVRIAVIPVGYADGLYVEKSRDTFRFRDILRYGYHDFKLIFKKPHPICHINGRPAELLGRVGLCNVVADVSGVDCKPGDTAVFEVNPLYVNANVKRIYQ